MKIVLPKKKVFINRANNQLSIILPKRKFKGKIPKEVLMKLEVKKWLEE